MGGGTERLFVAKIKKKGICFDNILPNLPEVHPFASRGFAAVPIASSKC